MRSVRLLRSPDFRLLVLSNGLSSLGDELALVALTIKVFELSSGSGLAVAAVLLAGIIPLVVFAPLAGLIVDRTETTGTLALASVAQALIAVGLAFAEPVWLVVALSFLLGSAASVASPAVFAIVPTAVDEEDLTEANANMETVRYIGMVAGPLIAGGLAGALGADKGTRVALLLDAITFLVITSAAASLRVRRMPEPAPEGGRTKGEARRGFAFIRRDRVLLIGVAVVAATVLFATMDNVAEVFFANDPALLNAGNWGYGELAAVWLLGMVVGAGVIARRLHQEQLAPAVLLASITGGAAVAVAALFPHIALALAMFAVGGVANGVASVSMRSLIHHRAPDELRGRVFAAYFGVAFAGQLAATALGGVLIAILPNSQDVLLIGGVGGAVVGLIGMAWYAALPSEARAPMVVHLPETAPVEPGMVVVRDITPSDMTQFDDAVAEPIEVSPSVHPRG
ncbi:MAG: MFS transporter [Actinomycetota bacterium]